MTTTRTAPSTAILSFGLEFIAVALFTVIAGTSDSMGTLTVLFLVGLWLIFLITESGTVSTIETALTSV